MTAGRNLTKRWVLVETDAEAWAEVDELLATGRRDWGLTWPDESGSFSILAGGPFVEGPWVVEAPPDMTQDGFLDYGGAGMVVRGPNGTYYEVGTADMVPMSR